MNNIYKLKFSRKTHELVAVAEIATNAIAGSTTTPSSALATGEETCFSSILSSSLVKLGVLAGSALTLALGSAIPAWANNGLVEPSIVAGAATIVTNGSVTIITNSPNTIINWQQFNIGKNELVQFIQESSNSAVLNRVLGNSVSEILGTLKSNGKVLLINPNGILFGANAMVDTNGLIASTLNLSDADFQAGKYVFNQEKDRALASVLNQGVIKVNNDGTLALVGGNVVNTGILEAKNGSVYLLAGQSIQIADLNNPLISFKVTAGNKAVNLGEIVAKNVTMLAHGVNHGKDPVGNAFSDLYTTGSANSSRISATGEVELFAGSVSDQLQTNKQTNAQVTGERSGLVVMNGEISTTNATGSAGSVKILGDTVYVGKDSLINANGRFGGSVNIGGDYQGKGNLKLAQVTTLASGQEINVSAQGNAGTAIVWGDSLTVDGTLKATSEQGKGGFIETSGKGLTVREGTVVTTKSQAGVNGEWLLDPQYLEIVSSNPSGGTQVSNSSSGNEFVYGERGTPNGSRHYILNSTIEAGLETGNVTLKAINDINATGISITSSNKTTWLKLESYDVRFNNVNFDIGNFHYTPDWFGGDSFIARDSILTIAGSFVINSKKPNNVDFTNSKLSANDISIDIFSASRSVNVNNSTLNATNSIDIKGGVMNFANKAEFNAPTIKIKLIGDNAPYGKSSWSSVTFNSKDKPGNVTLENAKGGFGGITANIYATNFTTSGNFEFTNGLIDVQENMTHQSSGKLNINQIPLIVAKDLKVTGGSLTLKSGADKTIDVKGSFTANTNGDIYIDGNVSIGAETCLTVANGFTLKNGLLNTTKAAITSTNSVVLESANITTRDEGISFDITGDKHFQVTGSNLSAAGGTKDVTVHQDQGWATVSKLNVSGQNFKMSLDTGNQLIFNDSNISVGNEINITSGINDVFRTDTKVDIIGTNLSAGGAVVVKGNKNTNTLNNSNISGTSVSITAGTDLRTVGATIKGSDAVNVLVKEANANTNLSQMIATGASLCVTVEGGNLTMEGANLTSTQAGVKVVGSNVTLTNSNISANTSLDVEFGKLKATTSTFHSKYGATTIGTDASETATVSGSKLTTGLYTDDVPVQGADPKQDLTVKAQTVAVDTSVLNSCKDLTLNATTQTLTVCSTEMHAGAVGNLHSGTNLELNDFTGATSFGSDLTLTSTGGQATIHNYSLNVGQNFCVSAATKINVDVSTIEAQDGIATRGDATDVKFENTNFTARGGDISVGVDKVVNMSVAGTKLVTGYTKEEQEQLVAAGKPVPVVTPADINLNGTNISVGSSTFSSSRDLNISSVPTNPASEPSQVIVTSSNFEIARSINVTSETVSLTGGVMNSGTSTSLNATGGELTVQGGATVTSTGEMKLESTGNLNLDQASVKGSSVEVKATGKDSSVKALNSTLNATTTTLTVTGNKNVEFGEGTNVTGKGAVSVTATTGTLTATGTNFTSETSVALSSKEKLTLTNSNISGGAISTESTKGEIEVNGGKQTGTTVTATAKEGLTVKGGAIVTGSDAVSFSSTNATAQILDSNITSTGAKVTVAGKEGVTLNNSNISGNSVEVSSSNATAKVENSTVHSGTTLTLKGKTNVEVVGGAKLDATGEVAVTAEEGKVTVTDSNITSTGAKVGVTAKTGIELENSNITGVGVSLATNDATGATGDIVIKGATVDGKTGELYVSSSKDVNIGTTGSNPTVGSKLSSQGDAKVVAKGNFVMTDSNITSQAKAELDITGSVELTNSNISGSSVEIDSETSTVTLGKSQVFATSDAGDLKVSAKSDVKVSDGTILDSKNTVTVESREGALTAENSNITAAAKAELKGQTGVTLTNTNTTGSDIVVNSTEGKITATNSNLTSPAGSVTMESKGDIELNNSNITGKSVTVHSTENGVKVTGSSTVKGTDDAGVVNFTGKTAVTVEGKSLVEGAGDVKAEATQGTLTLDDSKINATKTADIKGQSGVTLTKGNVTAATGITVGSAAGGVTATGSNLTSESGKIGVSAFGPVSLTDTNVSGTSVDVASTGTDATKATVTISGGDYKATQEGTGAITVTAPGAVDIKGGAKLDSKGTAKVDSTASTTTVTDSNITAAGKAEVTAKEKLTLSNSNISGSSVEMKSMNAGVDVTGGNFKATDVTGALTVSGKEAVAVTGGAKLNSEGTAKVESTNSSTTVTDSNITATGKAEVVGKEAVTLSNSNISGSSLDVKSIGTDPAKSTVTITGGDLKATEEKTGALTVTAPGAVTVQGGAKFESKGTAKVDSTASTTTVTDSNITAAGKAEVTAKEKLTLSNSNISGSSLEIKSTNAGVDVTGGNFKATDAQGSLTISGKDAVEVTGGAKLNSEGTAKVESTNGATTVKDSNITAAGKVDVLAKDKLTLDNSNITGVGVNLQTTDTTGTAGDIVVKGTTVNAQTGPLTVTAAKDITIEKGGNPEAGSKLTTAGEATVKATGDFTMTDSNITSLGAKTSVSAGGAVNMDNSNVSGTSAEVKSTGQGTGATVTVTGGNIAATDKDGTLTVTADGAVTVKDGAILDSKGAAKVESTGSTLDVTGSNITAGTTAQVVAKDKVTLDNANITGASVELNSTDAGVDVKGGNFKTTAPDGAFTLTGKTDVTVTDGAKVDAAGAATVESREGSTTVTDSNITAATKAEVKAATDVTLTNANVTGNDVVVDATAGKVTATDSNLASPTGKVDVNAKYEVVLTNSNLSGTSVTVDSTDKGVAITGGSATATAKDGTIAVTGAEDVKVTGGAKLDSQGTAKVESTAGSVEVKDSNITAAGKVDVLAKDQLTLDNSNITGVGVNLATTDKDAGDIVVKGATVDAKDGDLTVSAAKDLTIAKGDGDKGVGSKLSAQGAATVTAGGDLTLTDSNITSSGAKASVSAGGAVSMTNSNISGTSAEVKSTGTDPTTSTVTISGGNIDATDKEKGELTVTGAGPVKVTNGAILESAGSAKVESTAGAVEVTDSNITSATTAEVKAATDVTLSNANVTGNDVVVNATEGKVILTDSNLASPTGKVAVDAKQEVVLTNSNLSGTSVAVDSAEKGVTITGGSATATAEDGAITVTGAEDVKVVDGAILDSKGSAKVESIGGVVEVKDSNITAATKAEVKAATDVTLTNANVTGNDVVVGAIEGEVTVTDSNLASPAGNVAVSAKGDIELNNSNITGKGVDLNSTEHGVTVTGGSQITGTDPDSTVNITGNTSVKVDGGSKVDAKGDVKVDATNGPLTVTDSNITSDTKVDLGAATDITLSNANITGNDVVLHATEGKVTVTDSNLASPVGNVAMSAKGDIELNNSNITGKGVDLNSTENGITVTGGSQITGTDPDSTVNITGNTSVKVDGGSKVDAKGDVNVNATNGPLTVTDSNITSEAKVDLTAQDGITLTNSNISGSSVDVNSTAGTVDINGGNVNATDPAGSLTVTGDQGVKVENGAKLDSKGDASVAAPNGTLEVVDSNITAADKVDLTAQDGITLNNSNITGASVDVNSTAGTVDINGGNVNVTDPAGSLTVTGDQGVKVENGAKLDSKGEASVAASHGALEIVDSNITAAGKVGLTAQDNITLNNANITGHGGVEVNSTAGNVDTADSQLTSNRGDVDIVATGNITLGNGTKVTGNDVMVNSTVGSVDVEGTNITATTGTVDVTAKENVTINNSNITGRNDVTITATNGTADVQDTALNSDNANVTVSGDKGTTVDNITATAGKDVNIKSPNGNVTANNVTATAGNNITLAAPNGNLTSTGGKYVGNNLLASSQGDLVFTDNHEELDGDASFKVTDGRLDLERNSGYGTTLILEYPSVDKLTDLDNTWVFSKVARASKQINTPEIELEDPIKPEDVLRNDVYRDNIRGMMDEGVTLTFDGHDNSLKTAPLNKKGTLLSTDSSEDTNLTLGAEGSNANSNNNNSNGVPSTQVPVTLGSCPAQAQTIAAKYGMSTADYSGMNLTDLKRKYKMTEADAQAMRASCNINFDWDKMSINQFLGK